MTLLFSEPGCRSRYVEFEFRVLLQQFCDFLERRVRFGFDVGFAVH
jgi:hypothetical protein